MPRVVTAAVPNRRPLVYHGPLGSNGIGLRFKVIPHRRTASSAWRPVMPCVERDVEDQQVIVGASGEDVQSLAHERFGQGAGVVDDPLGVRLQIRAGAPR